MPVSAHPSTRPPALAATRPMETQPLRRNIEYHQTRADRDDDATTRQTDYRTSMPVGGNHLSNDVPRSQHLNYTHPSTLSSSVSPPRGFPPVQPPPTRQLVNSAPYESGHRSNNAYTPGSAVNDPRRMEADRDRPEPYTDTWSSADSHSMALAPRAGTDTYIPQPNPSMPRNVHPVFLSSQSDRDGLGAGNGQSQALDRIEYNSSSRDNRPGPMPAPMNRVPSTYEQSRGAYYNDSDIRGLNNMSTLSISSNRKHFASHYLKKQTGLIRS